MKLVRVARTQPIDFGLPGYRNRDLLFAINPRKIDMADESLSEAEFFEVADEDLEGVVTQLATANPGKEIRVYDLKQVCVCPAGAMITKRVSEDGILPN